MSLSWSTYKIGVDEIAGLKTIMRTALKPIKAALEEHLGEVSIDDSEYKHRDGFIPHSENLGGPEIRVIIPKCLECEFPSLSFGECDTPEDCQDECLCDTEGHLDAALRVWFKLESYDSTSSLMTFYLYAGGGNNDAPYFRTKYEKTVFEAEFAATLDTLATTVAPKVRELLTVLAIK